MDLSQIELIYRAEGNANLVIYLPQQKEILRLPKLTKGSAKNELDTRDHVAYINFMEYLLGTEYITRPKILQITDAERDKLNRFCAPFRPAERLDKEYCGQFGLLFPDATDLLNSIDSTTNTEVISGDTFGIEIKPKQGWMLQDLVSSCGDLFDLKGSTRCRYCCMQFSKLKSEKIQKLSSYCPMDLFSGTEARMQKALDGLLENPQNNLRIFRNSILCYGYQSPSAFNQLNQIFGSDFQLIKNLIIKLLLLQYCCKNHDDTPVTEQLPIGCVLDKVLRFQLLTKKNIKFMNELAGLEMAKIDKSYNYFKSLISKIALRIDDDLTQIDEYMLGATLLDCSIMIAFREIQSHDPDLLSWAKSEKLVQIENRNFVTKITILDIDPKADNHFYKFVTKTNQAYLDAF